MTQNVTRAQRLIEAFIALMLGRRVPVSWDTRAGIDTEGGIHLPMPTTGDAAEIALLTRLAVHEGGHILETQQGFAERLSPDEVTVFNVLEAPRMENRQMRRYPGASVVLSRGLDEMLQNIEDSLDATLEQIPERAVHLDLLMRGFLAVAPHGPIARHAPRLLERIAPRVSDAQRVAIDEVVTRLPDLSTSIEAEEAARAFLARLREQDVPPPPPSEPGDQQDQQEHQPEAGGSSAPNEQDSPQDENQQDPPSEANQAEGGDDQRQDQSPPSEGDGAGDGDGGANSPQDGDTGNGSADAGVAGADEQATQEGNEQPEGSEGSENSGDSGSAGSADANSADPQSADGGGENRETGAGGGEASGDAGAANEPGGGLDPQSGSGQQQAPDQATTGQGQPAQQGTEGDQQQDNASSGGNAGGFDLGELLREALVSRYGLAAAGETAEVTTAASGPEALTDEELQRVEAMLAQADPSAPLEELVEASLAALAQTGDGPIPDSPPGSGAGMSLANEPSAPTSLVETRLQGVQARLVTVLQRELQDKRRRPTRPAHAGGRVMPQRFWRLSTLGDTKVFASRRTASGIDAAATVLLDSSSSMDAQLRVAAEVTMAFSLALQRLGVRTRVARFPGADTVTETLQRFGESPRSCVQRCAGLVASGGTPVGAATAAETSLLLNQHRLKNVLLVVTDDDPGDAQTFRAALARAEELDVLVVGVGIGCDIRMWIPHSVSVGDVNELPDALARLFRENISVKLAA